MCIAVDPEHRVLVRVEGCRAAVGDKISLQRFEVSACALARHEAQLHQAAGGIVDEDQQRATITTVLEPAMFAAIDLDQLAVTLAPQPGLMKTPALLAR